MPVPLQTASQVPNMQMPIPTTLTPPLPTSTLDMSAVRHGYAERVLGGTGTGYATAVGTPVATPRNRSQTRRGRRTPSPVQHHRARDDSQDEAGLHRGYGTRMLTVETQLKRQVESISRQSETTARLLEFQGQVTEAVGKLEAHAKLV